MKNDDVCSVALHDLGPGGTVILIYPMYPLAHSETSQTHFFPRAHVQCALPIGMPFF